jgi:hypothetical protein
MACKSMNSLAPQVGFEPTTLRLTTAGTHVDLIEIGKEKPSSPLVARLTEYDSPSRLSRNALPTFGSSSTMRMRKVIPGWVFAFRTRTRPRQYPRRLLAQSIRALHPTLMMPKLVSARMRRSLLHEDGRKQGRGHDSSASDQVPCAFAD